MTQVAIRFRMRVVFCHFGTNLAHHRPPEYIVNGGYLMYDDEVVAGCQNQLDMERMLKMKKGWLVFIALILAIESLLVPPGAAAAGLAFTSVSSQVETSVALDSDGEIYAWGSNWN